MARKLHVKQGASAEELEVKPVPVGTGTAFQDTWKSMGRNTSQGGTAIDAPERQVYGQEPAHGFVPGR